ncbi:hypothetical protein [Amycolatopsis anabasis]|uniref:hypothetical protein n=1 Tax=Amycolatopsis anabasis TaxID=1840409 RepID=UPI00131D31ED|nr:hypothetical protein [Amycolatopsis anabasis]
MASTLRNDPLPPELRVPLEELVSAKRAEANALWHIAATAAESEDDLLHVPPDRQLTIANATEWLDMCVNRLQAPDGPDATAAMRYRGITIRILRTAAAYTPLTLEATVDTAERPWSYQWPLHTPRNTPPIPLGDFLAAKIAQADDQAGQLEVRIQSWEAVLRPQESVLACCSPSQLHKIARAHIAMWVHPGVVRSARAPSFA